MNTYQIILLLENGKEMCSIELSEYPSETIIDQYVQKYKAVDYRIQSGIEASFEKAKKMDEEAYDAYWRDILENRRQPLKNEANRLAMMLYGFLYQHNQYEAATNRNDHMDAISFWDSKRPYGNKDIPCSIAYVLGWDYQRLLTGRGLPAFAEEEAWKLHDMVKQEILEQDEFIRGVKERIE